MDGSTIRANPGSGSMRITPVDSTRSTNTAYGTVSSDQSINSQQEKNNDQQEVKAEMMMMRAYPYEEWLPITESRNGNLYSCIFHLLNSGIAFQAFLLPVAFKHLGWYWGISTLLVAFGWQLYTSWLLVQLHESPTTGTRYSRYLHLSMEAFGPKLGKILVLFPIMYLSGGTCVMSIINVGTIMELFHSTVLCHRQEDSHICYLSALTVVEWYIIFVCLVIIVALFLPNMNSVTYVSLIGAITAVLCYCSTTIWVFYVAKSRPHRVSYAVRDDYYQSEMDKVMNVLSAVGIIGFSFRGHNLLLEIQGTLQANSTQKTMWEGVRSAYLLIAALCFFPMAIGGYWAYGNQIPDGGILTAINHSYHNNKNGTLTALLGSIYFLLFINSLCIFQIYAMPVFDNLELRWLMCIRNGKPCTRYARAMIRLFFGGLTFFIAVMFPFLPKISALVGGIALPVTFAYPCFMWIAIKKPQMKRAAWWMNLCLGCCGGMVSVLVIVSAVWNLVKHHFHANFYHPSS